MTHISIELYRYHQHINEYVTLAVASHNEGVVPTTLQHIQANVARMAKTKPQEFDNIETVAINSELYIFSNDVCVIGLFMKAKTPSSVKELANLHITSV